MDIKFIYLLIPLLPLLGSVVTGLFCRVMSRAFVYGVTIFLVGLSTLLSFWVLYQHMTGELPIYNEDIYTWMDSGMVSVSIGLLVDNLTAIMMAVVTFVSFMVHIYSIGYMADDQGARRFFSYISLFTFSMLMLVMSNNFMQLFFGWEAVGLVSYLLIGFYVDRPSAIYANMKAFIANRVGDFGMIIGIACVLVMTGSLHYEGAFANLEQAQTTFEFLGTEWHMVTIACIFLFIGAMAKSAQIPLHVWLPDSMEGPTPISALIHAATMVTAGIFMVSRMAPLYELSDAALSFILIIGACTAFFMGILGIFQNDIKRVVAYSTISQLGYMTVALGASAYSLAIFHLATHAFFKALLFLGAGSVIIAMHHEQDMRVMGGLAKKMPITYITTLLGGLALVGMPFFSGYYSKEGIIGALAGSELFGSRFASWALVLGVFITALYTFRQIFMVFHGKARYTVDSTDHSGTFGVLHAKPKESPLVVTIPLILLAIPSVVIGWYMAPEMFNGNFLKEALEVNGPLLHGTMAAFQDGFNGLVGTEISWEMTREALVAPPFYLTLAGIIVAWFVYMVKPIVATEAFGAMKRIRLLPLFINNYYFDKFNEVVVSGGTKEVGTKLWKKVDEALIMEDAILGTAHLSNEVGGLLRKIQTGFLYHATFLMIIGLLGLMSWVVFN